MDYNNDNYLSYFDFTREISFINHSINCCVCFVDMLDSTKITAKFSDPQKIRQYYSIFINTMATLAKNYGAKIVKTAGHSLIFYFPDSSDSCNQVAFKDILECFTTMVAAHSVINSKLHAEGNLPSISYRISADYGKVEVASSTSSKREDLFGSTMNICAKINSMAEPNGIVIGENLYRIIKSFSFVNNGFEFQELEEGYSIGFGDKYPVYTVLSNNNIRTGSNIDDINRLIKASKISKIEEDVETKRQQQPLPSLLIMPQDSQQKQKQQPYQKYSANIMVVDDEPDILFTYEWFLSDEGYNIEAFTDPQEALKHFVHLFNPASYYHLVLLDIRMPRLNGLHLFNTIKTLSPETKIMFVSALDIAEELISIFPDIKYDDIIKKPVERDYFISKVNSALGNSTANLTA